MVCSCRVVAQGWYHALGVPLYTEQRCGFVQQCLDRPVLRPCGGVQTGCNDIHRLMVIAVDHGRSPGQCRKPGDAAHPVAAIAVAFDVLPERAAQKDIDCLYPAADPEDGFAAAEERPE